MLTFAQGGNTCIVLEVPPERPEKGQVPRAYHVVACSARTSCSLKANKERVLQYLRSDEEAAISDVAYTTTARRMHDVSRSSYVVQTSKDLIRLISNNLEQPAVAKPKSASGHNRMVFAFTGKAHSIRAWANDFLRRLRVSGTTFFRTRPSLRCRYNRR